MAKVKKSNSSVLPAIEPTDIKYRGLEIQKPQRHKILKVIKTSLVTEFGFYVFEVHSESAKGEKYVSEYYCQQPNQEVFFEGVYQWLKCLRPGSNADEIEPCEEPANNSTPAIPQRYPESRNYTHRNSAVMGTKASIAIGIAKDITVARIAAGATSQQGNSELFGLADEIYEWFNKKENNR